MHIWTERIIVRSDPGDFVSSENIPRLSVGSQALCVLLRKGGSSKREAVPCWLSWGFRLGNEMQVAWLLIPLCPQVRRKREEAEGWGNEQAVCLET